MSRKLYPIGIQTFERIRKEDMLYVDKTEYVYHMTHTDGKYFFPEPSATVWQVVAHVNIPQLFRGT